MTMRPLIVTMGDPAGVGPEIIARAWSVLSSAPGPLAPVAPFVVVGDAAVLKAQGQPVGLTPQGGAFGRGRIARGMGQGQHALGQLGAVTAEMHLQLGLFGQGSSGVRQCALEGLDGGLCGGHPSHIDHTAAGERGRGVPGRGFHRGVL